MTEPREDWGEGGGGLPATYLNKPESHCEAQHSLH